MELVLIRVVPEAFFWINLILVVVSEIMRLQRSNSKAAGRRSRSQTTINSTNGLDQQRQQFSEADVKNADEHATYGAKRRKVDCRKGDDETADKAATNGARRASVDCRRDRNRDNLRELRRHHRSMKDKYHQNSDNLLYFCFYKGITEKYYDTLREC